MGSPNHNSFSRVICPLTQKLWTTTLAIFAVLLVLPNLILSQQLCLDQPTQPSCLCPIGSSGTPDCDRLTCGDPYLNATARPAFDPSLAGSSGNAGCSQQCTTGFGGNNCNICLNTQACRSADPNHSSNSSAIPSSPLGSVAAPNLTCNNDNIAYGVKFGQCEINNPTIQAVVPGKLSALIQHMADISATSFPSSLFSGFSNASILVKIVYAANSSTPPQDAFSCAGSNCTQQINGGTVSSICSSIKCNCPARSVVCGGGPLDLAGAIKTISGSVSLDCPVNNANSTEQCSIKMDALKGIFGPQGLKLSSCQFGECVQQGTVDMKRLLLEKKTTSSISGEVIAALAVIGTIILAFLGFILLGLIQQRRARKGLGAAQSSSSAARVDWQDLRYSLPPKGSLGCLRRRKSPHLESHPSYPLKNYHDATNQPSKLLSGGQQILSGLTGSAAAGSMMAILGPSGAGKSTFVDVLAGQRKTGKLTGNRSIAIPGKPDEPLIIGFVDQSDILHSTSTVKEAMMFAACLKLPESLPNSTKQARVFEIIELLGLSHVADSRIGDDENRGLSGGERRRLSIGLELIGSPSVLFLDEPTSGLDSVSALRVVNALKSLAAGALKGTATTIICSIHQPSSQIYYAFDNICLLAPGGRQIFCGPTARATEFLASHGLTCPQGFNPADYLLDVAFDPPASVFESPDNSDTKAMFEGSLSPVVTPASSSTWSNSAPSLVNAHPRVTFMTQFQQLCKREWKALRYDPNLLWAHVGSALFLGVFAGGMYFQVNDTVSGFQNRVGSLFFMSAILVFTSLSSLTNFSSAKLLFMRERATGYYSPIAWIMSRVLFDAIPLRVLPTIVMGSIIYWMVGLQPRLQNFLKLLLVLVVLQLAEMMFNFWLGATIRNSGKAILISSMVIMAQLAFAGFFVNLKALTPVLKWIQYLMPLKYSLEAMAENEVGSGLMIKDSIEGVKVTFPASTVLKLLFGFGEGAFWKDLVVLLAFSVVLSFALIVSVHFKLKQVR